MTVTSKSTFRIPAFPAPVLDSVRALGVDAFGIPAERINSEGGNALRCCLRDSEPGEELILFGYQPPLPAGPYREVGAVLVHADPCAGPVGATGYPSQWRGRPQILRAYDRRGWIHDATAMHDGRDPEEAIAKVLADPGVAQIHSRNVEWGCFMFAIVRG